MTLSKVLTQISARIEDIPKDERREYRDELSDLREEAVGYQGGEQYQNYVSRKLRQAHAIRQGHSATGAGQETVADGGEAALITSPAGLADATEITEVDWNQIPLCGCGSPTCDVLDGTLPPDCRDRTNGLMSIRTPQDRVVEHIETHENPWALMVIQQGWAHRRDELEAQAEDLLARVDAKRTLSQLGQRYADE